MARSGGEEIQWKMKLKGGDLYNLGICSASVLGCFFHGKLGEKRLVPREKVDANATFFCPKFKSHQRFWYSWV